jgi:hypothetical protein
MFAGTQQTGGSSTDLEAVVPADELDAEYVQVVVELLEALGAGRRRQAGIDVDVAQAAHLELVPAHDAVPDEWLVPLRLVEPPHQLPHLRCDRRRQLPIDLMPAAIHPTSREHVGGGGGERHPTRHGESDEGLQIRREIAAQTRGSPTAEPPGPAALRVGKSGVEGGTYEVDGRLDVLDEGGGALVLGRRVAVHAAHVLCLPSGVGDDVLRPRRAAADETHHLRLPPPAQPRLRSGGCFASPASLQLLALLLACWLAWLDG